MGQRGNAMLCNLPRFVRVQNRTQPKSRPYPNLQCSVHGPMQTGGQKTRPFPFLTTPMATIGTTQMN